MRVGVLGIHTFYSCLRGTPVFILSIPLGTAFIEPVLHKKRKEGKGGRKRKNIKIKLTMQKNSIDESNGCAACSGGCCSTS